MEWLKGKKTFIAAGVIALTAIYGFFIGRVDDVQLGTLLGVALAIAGYRDALGQYLPFIIAALDEIKKSQAAKGTTVEVRAFDSQSVQDFLAKGNADVVQKLASGGLVPKKKELPGK